MANKPQNKKSPAKKRTVNVKSAGKSKNGKNTVTNTKNDLKSTALTVVLFAVSVLLFFVTIIEGDNLWFDMHCTVLGIFGSLAIFWSVLLIYAALGISAHKQGCELAVRCFTAVAVLFLISTFIYVFFNGADYHIKGNSASYGEILSACYEEASRGNGIGIIGALLGALLGTAFGLTGAKIVVILIIFVFVMISTRTKVDFVYNWFEKIRAFLISKFASSSKFLEQYKQKHTEKKKIQSAEAEKKRAELEKQRAEHLTEKVERSRKKAEFEREEREFFGFDTDDNKQSKNPTPEAQTKKSKPAQQPTVVRKFTSYDDFFEDDDEPEDTAEEKDVSKIKFDESEGMLKNQKYLHLKSVLGIEAVEEEAFEQPTAEQVFEQPEQETYEESEGEATAEESDGEEARFSTIEPIGEDEIIPPQDAVHEENADFYRFPPINLLAKSEDGQNERMNSEIMANSQKLVDTLKSFGVATKILDTSIGPAVTRYELQPMAGVKISRITGLADDIALNLAAGDIRIEAPIPGKPAVGIEIPNEKRATVGLRNVIDTNEFTVAKSKLTVALGKDISGKPAFADISKMPHLLIAGATGSGKSVCINTIIVSILYKASPDEVKLLMVDPKKVELGIYNGIPHLLVPVVTDAKKAAGALAWAVTEMLKRYETFSDNNVRDIVGYNALAEMTEGMKKMERIVIIIDELADLMMVSPHEVEESICRLAQMARAAGMYLIIATQRPSVDIITGVIKANIPSRIAFAVSSQVDSRTIIDMAGAEKLLGKGDMLFLPMGESKTKRIQGCFVSDSEIEHVVEYIKNCHTAEYNEEVAGEIDHQAEIAASKGKGSKGGAEMADSGDADELMMQAIEFVVDAGQASTSMLQRRLRVGYARAGRLIDEMEQMGIVGPYEGSKARSVLMTKTQLLEWKAGSSGTEE